MILDVAERAAETVAEAIFTARSGRPGPVVVGLPEDVIRQRVPRLPQSVLPIADGGMTSHDLEELEHALNEARRPLFVTGGSDWDPGTAQALTRWLEDAGIPAAAEWRTEGIVPFDSPAYVGPIGYGRPASTFDLLEECDLLVFVGTLPGDVVTNGFIARQDWSRRNFLVSIDASLRGRSGAVSHHILARPCAFVRDLLTLRISPQPSWGDWGARLRARQEQFAALPSGIPGDGVWRWASRLRRPARKSPTVGSSSAGSRKRPCA